MATRYVSSVSGDGSDGTTWAKAYLSISAALAVSTADGDRIEVDSAHSFTSSSAAISYNLATANTSVSVVSVDRNGSTTTGNNGLLAGATESVGTDAFAFSIASGTVSQTPYFWGITINSASGGSGGNIIVIGSTSTNNTEMRPTLENCTFNLRGSNGGSTLGIGVNTTPSRNMNLRMINCTVNIKSVASTNGINLSSGNIDITGLTVGYFGATKPPVLFGTGSGVNVTISDSDLSAFNSGNYFDMTGTTQFNVVVRNCKINATPGITTGTITTSGSLTLVNVDSGNTFTQFQYTNILGTLTSITSIYDNGNASVNATNLSYKVVTTSTCSESRPFICPWITRFSPTTSSVTAGIHLIHDSATNLNNRNLWAEFEYVSGASSTLGTNVSIRNAIPFAGTAVDCASDTDTWTGTGGFTNPNKQKLEKTFTPSNPSLIRGRLIVGVASKTLYFDPLLRLA